MAALYLHQALFANDPQSPFASTPRSSRLSPDAQASLSKLTLRTSTSEHSHPTESLFYDAEDSAYRDILARQPVLPEGSRMSWAPSLSLEGDPLTPGERKRHWERLVRRRLHRLRWAKRVLLAIIASWAVYNTVRYFIAFTVYTTFARQLLLLVSGAATAVSWTLLAVARILSSCAPRLGWKRRSRSLYTRTQTTLAYTASFLLFGPAVVNLVFVVLWMRSPDPGLSLQGRCRWDIDAAWAGIAFQCDANHAVPWRYWLAGSVVRLVLTAVILASYHIVSFKYMVTRRVCHRGRRAHAPPVSSYLSPLGSPGAHSPHSPQPMLSTALLPISVPHPLRQSFHISQSTSDSDFTHESMAHSSSSGHPLLRRSQSHISSVERHSADLRAHRLSSSGRSLPSEDAGHASGSRGAHALDSPASSYEDLPAPPAVDSAAGYASPVNLAPGSYSVPAPPEQHAFPQRHQVMAEEDMHGFVERFRALVQQVSRETEAGIQLAREAEEAYYDEDEHADYMREEGTPSPFEQAEDEDEDDVDYVPVVGRFIQRMPTIESLGSREVTSLTSPASRPSTRQACTPSVSRSNSLTVSIVLSAHTDGASSIGEFGEINRAQDGGGYAGGTGGSRSTGGSYHTASGRPLSADSAAAQA